MHVKIEINTREHVTVLGTYRRPLAVEGPRLSGAVDIRACQLGELFGAKLRVLDQRQKGCDVDGVWLALRGLRLGPRKVVACFQRSLDQGGTAVSRAEFERKLAATLKSPQFVAAHRTAPSLQSGVEREAARADGHERLIASLPGAPLAG